MISVTFCLPWSRIRYSSVYGWYYFCPDSTFEAHLKSLEQRFSVSQAAGLTLKPSKLQFGQKEIEYRGHVISGKGISISADCIRAFLALPEPECIKDNRGCLGTLSYVRRFIDGYAEITAPLVELTRKGFVKKTAFKKALGTAQREAFARAKRAVTSAPVLKYPDFTPEFVALTDSSEEAGVGAFPAQPSLDGSSDSDLDMIAYYSHCFSKSQRHSSATMKKCCAVVWAVTHWRPYLWGKHFTCCTNHQALTYV